MTEADTTGSAPNTPEAASEHMIPKYRLDEVLGRLRQAEQEIQLKNQILNQVRPPAQAPADELDFESMGLDPSIGRAIAKIASQVSARQTKEAAQGIQNTLSQALRNGEEAKFIAQHGADKAKYLDRIKEIQLQNWQLTGTGMPIETAYKVAMFDELNNATRPRAPAATASQAPQAPAPQAPAPAASYSGVPDASQTGPVNGGNPQSQPKKSIEDELSELEMSLNQRMASSGETI